MYSITISPLGDSKPTIVFINPDISFHKLNPGAICCTILHEMGHAFLGRYGCLGGDGSACETALCRQVNKLSQGRTGHGRAWQYLAKAIEEKLPDVLGFKGRLGRQECMLQELDALGFRPSECDISNLYSDFGRLVRLNKRRWFDDSDIRRKAALRDRRLGKVKKRTKRRWSIGVCQGLGERW